MGSAMRRPVGISGLQAGEEVKGYARVVSECGNVAPSTVLA
jgi:hypothetical protein